jgi:predicted dehydrogenase/threonine dehydrogenase-like Zn-dependent dehydrogenase
MKIILQNFKNGEMKLEDVPPPSLKDDGVIVRTHFSLISSGTEKAVIDLAKMNMLSKAKARPDLVKKVLSKAGQEGLYGTYKIVKNLVSSPLPLGYSIVGEVIEVGRKVHDIKPGHYIAGAGLGYANHAEINYIPRNLVTPIPKNIKLEDASFITVGAIAMQGIRQANLQVGENVLIIGLGLIGQLCAQISNASGCNVYGIESNKDKIDFIKKNYDDINIFNANNKNIPEKIKELTFNYGIDKVIIAASTKSSKPINLATQVLRDRGEIIIIGEVGHNLNRRSLYEKEISLKQARSYGPGRYEVKYEEKGLDYPIGYVRWTENRNMASFLDLIAKKNINVNKLITHKYKIDKALDAYSLLLENKNELIIGILLLYNHKKIKLSNRINLLLDRKAIKGQKSLGIIGAGQFAQGVLLPELIKNKFINFKAFASTSGLTTLNVGKKYNAEYITSNLDNLFHDKSIDSVFIASRHDSHCELVCRALETNKDVFVEKPLALNATQLKMIEKKYFKSKSILMVGYNRRFSEYSENIKENFKNDKLIINYRINAGYVSDNSWQQDDEYGGGRIIGEICHFIDWIIFITSSYPISIYANNLSIINKTHDPDNLIINMELENGSLSTITYLSNGDSRVPKENIEIFGGGKTGIIDNWRSIKIYCKDKIISKRSYIKSVKGFDQEMKKFAESLKNRINPIDFEELKMTSLATFAIIKSLKTGEKILLR